jgi:hypothetical protein
MTTSTDTLTAPETALQLMATLVEAGQPFSYTPATASEGTLTTATVRYRLFVAGGYSEEPRFRR